MQQLLDKSTLENLEEGSIIKGTIIEIRQSEVVIDIGGKSEGVIPLVEFVDPGELEIGGEN